MKEQIEQQALLETNYTEGNCYAFKRCVEQTDEHPNLSEEEQVGMNELGIMWQKQALIKKACEWLQLNAVKYMRSIGGCMYFDVINSVNDFKKIMEE